MGSFRTRWLLVLAAGSRARTAGRPKSSLLPQSFGFQVLIHPNIKFSFEYQFRPEQYAVVEANSVTGQLTAVNPFRVNTALFGLEFLY